MSWLDELIPRRQALSMVLIANLGTVLVLVDKRIALKNAAEVYADQKQRNVILHEICDFLLERADDKTAAELNENLDYWRVVLGIDPQT